MRKRIFACALCMVCIVTLFSGCKSSDEKTGMNVYYMDALGNGLVAEKHELKSESREKCVEEAIQLLSSAPNANEARRTIPEDVEVLDVVFDKSTVTLNFNRNYMDLTGYTEVLVRAAVVKTLLQIKGVDSVAFYVADEPLLGKNGVIVGAMTSDTFIDDYGEETDSLTATTFTLYYSSADGKSLVKREMNFYCNNNIAKERLIIESLMKDSDSMDIKSVIPSGTKLLNATVNDGVCYVNFDSGFLKVDTSISSDVVLYAIVNSLTELDTVNKVQILVNGASAMPDNGLTFKLGTSYERDTSMVLEAVGRELQEEENFE